MLTYLAYVDDLLLLSRGDILLVTTLSTCLTQFGQMAGLNANTTKSHIFMAGIDIDIRGQLLSITGFQRGDFAF